LPARVLPLLYKKLSLFAGWLAIMFGGFYNSGDRVQLGGIKGDVMDIGVLRTTIMEQDNGLMAIYTTDGLY
jgi:small-conductance mechanosensitive channel